jgi:hypothetical protein
MSDSAINLRQYRGFADQPWRRVISYLLLLVLILGTPVLLSFVFDFNQWVGEFIAEYNENIPDFVLKDGELSMTGEMPLIFEDKSGDMKNVFIIDTSGKTDDSVLDDYDTGVFFSKKEAVAKRSALEKQSFSFSAFKGGEIDKADVEEILSNLKWSGIFIVLFGLIYFFLAKLCTAAVLGFVCLLFSAMQNSGLQYGQAFKITVYALTIPTLFQSLQQIIAPEFALGGCIYYTIALLYLWFAARVIRTKSEEESDKDIIV